MAESKKRVTLPGLFVRMRFFCFFSHTTKTSRVLVILFKLNDASRETRDALRIFVERLWSEGEKNLNETKSDSGGGNDLLVVRQGAKAAKKYHIGTSI